MSGVPMETTNLMHDRDRVICGAKTRAGTPCQRAPLVGRTRCALHGGKTPRGELSPHFKTGRHSRYLPERLRARYAEAARDPELLALDQEIRLLDALIADTLTRLDAGDGATLYEQLQAKWAELCRWRALGRVKELGASLEELGALIERGMSASEAQLAVVKLIEQRRKLAESEQRRLVAMQQFVSVEQAMLVIDVISAAVREHVHDPATLAAIARDLERLTAFAGRPARETDD